MIDLIRKIESFLQITHSGYAEHLIGGIFIAAILAYLVFNKTNMFWTAMFMAIVITSLIGLFKELIDPYLRGDRSKLDLVFTVLGSIIGAFGLLIYDKLKIKEF